MKPSWPARILAMPLRALVATYRYGLSPLLGVNCRFEPSCSVYAAESLRRHGAFRGSYLTLRRIARCHPWGSTGYDPVPEAGASEKGVEENTDTRG